MIAYPSPVMGTVLWPGFELIGDLQSEHVASTSSLQAANILFTLASELPYPELFLLHTIR